MPPFSVKLDGFKFPAPDEQGVVNLRDTALIDADCSEMAEAVFKKTMGIIHTTRKFTIKRVGGAPPPEPDVGLPASSLLDAMEDEIADIAETVPPPEADELGAPEPEEAVKAQPVVALPSEPEPLPSGKAPRGRGRPGKPTTLLSDPDGVREEIAKL